MADKNNPPQRPVPEAARNAGEGSPFSMPLDKGMDIMAAPVPKKGGAESAPSGMLEEAKQAAKGAPQEAAPSAKASQGMVVYYRGPRLWTMIAAMFLFPFLFNLGSELYLLIRAAIVGQMGGLRSAATPLSRTSAGKSDADKMIDSLALVIANQEKLLRDAGQRVVIIHPGYAGSFSYDAEKAKVKELAAVDLDDPVAGSDKFGKIKSAEVLSAVIESLDRILLNAAQNNISEFRVKNAMEAKRQSLMRLQELR